MLEVQDYLRFAVTLTAVLDPFLAVPVFVAVTAERDARRKARLAAAVTLTVFLVLSGAVLAGDAVLRITGASLPAFRVGGGLVLLLMSLAMLQAQPGGVRQTEQEKQELNAGDVPPVVPLAVPLLAGPGAISTAIIAAQPGGSAHLSALIGCILVVCLFLWIVLRVAHWAGERMGTTGLNIATRLFGLLLAAIAVQTMAEGLKELFPGIA